MLDSSLSDENERLHRKVAILEEMLEESSREFFDEAQQRNSINTLLHLSLQELSLADLLDAYLDIVLSQDFLNIENRGCVFLFHEESDTLELAAHRNLDPELVERCKILEKGQCLCGEEARGSGVEGKLCHRRELVSKKENNRRNYCSPLRAGDQLLGTLCVTLPALMPLSSEQREFLDAGADILAGAIQKILYRDEIASLNIIKRKEAEEALATEKERLAVTLRSIAEGVIATDSEGRVILVNKAAEKLTGWSNQDAQDHILADVLPVISEDTGKPYADLTKDVLKNGSLTGLDRHAVVVSADGNTRQIAVSGSPLHDWQSRTIGVVLIVRDITNAQKMEVELLKKRQLHSLGVLAGGIAHDFNNILTAIMGNIFLVSRLVEQESKAFKLLGEAEKASQRAAALVQQLLTFSKGGEPVKQAASMTEIISTTTNFVLRGSAVACEYKIAEDLWLADVDSGQMSQVIQNLVINAKHAMPDGGSITIYGQNIIKKKLDPLPLQEGSYLEIRVVDHGIGIPQKKIAHIFDPYFSTKEMGSGLGLAITHSIIGRHAGFITVDSKVDVGTTFTFYVPAMRGVGLVSPVSEAGEVQGHGLVLVMDDDEMVRNTTAEMLKSFGYQVELAEDGKEAVQKYLASMTGDTPFDVVIMDLTIPGGMGGREAVEIILQQDPEVQAIVASGYANDPILANPREYGFVAALVKPFHIDNLTASLHKIMEG